MSIEREIAFEVLGLPTFASDDEILHKYQHLALVYFPEKYNNNPYAVEQFRQLSEAVTLLLDIKRPSEEPMNLLDMYEIFQNLFLKGNESNPSTYDHEEDDDDDDALSSESFTTAGGGLTEEKKESAAENAKQLIQEEEDEKLKSERKKAKKKRRKERKKQEKLETEASKKQSPEKKKSSQEQSKNIKPQGGESSDSEEALDPNSAFVTVVAKKQKRFQAMDSKLEKAFINPVAAPQVRENPTSLLYRGRQLATNANLFAELEKYPQAVQLISEAIQLDPSDHRFYANRSYFYERLSQFDLALKDAEKCIALSPKYAKGYFRKGRALLGLKKFAQAEECFVEVLKLDNDSGDAIKELHSVKVLRIVEMGYTKQEAETALAQHSSVQESIESLISSQLTKATIQKEEDEEVFVSDDDCDLLETRYLEVKPSPPLVLPVKKKEPLLPTPQFPVVPSSSQPIIKTEKSSFVGAQAQPQKGIPSNTDVKMDPSNPEKHSSLWVGNIQSDVTEKEITSLFSQFGELLSVKVMAEKHCAFVNYKNNKAPGKAMQALQNLVLHGIKIIIRFPNLPGEPGIKKKPGVVSEAPQSIQEECYYWRTTGCIYGENCRNLHVKEHKGADKKPWHKTSTETSIEPIEKAPVKEVKSETVRSAPVSSAPFKSAPRTKLFVGNLPDGCSDETLRTLFSKYGKVTECDVIGSHGFVHMSTAEQAQLSVNGLNNYNLKGWLLSVVPSKSALHPTPGAPGRASKHTVTRSPFKR